MPDDEGRPIPSTHPTSPTPFESVFRAIAETRFPALREGLEAEGVDPFDRDAFLMVRPVVELVHALRPDEGLGGAMDEFIALVHHAYLFWDAGEPVARLSAKTCESLLAMAPRVGPGHIHDWRVYYVQFPARRIWGEPLAEHPYEPLDGCFVTRGDRALAATAIFGFHPDRAGFTVVLVGGERPARLAREDGSPLFAPVLPAGATASLYSVTGMEELLELIWRSDDLVRATVLPGHALEIG
jgi:hypothetical protein